MEGRVRASDDEPSRWSWPPAPAPVVDPDSLPPQPPPQRIKALHVITRFWAGSGGNTLLSATGRTPTSST